MKALPPLPKSPPSVRSRGRTAVAFPCKRNALMPTLTFLYNLTPTLHSFSPHLTPPHHSHHHFKSSSVCVLLGAEIPHNAIVASHESSWSSKNSTSSPYFIVPSSLVRLPKLINQWRRLPTTRHRNNITVRHAPP